MYIFRNKANYCYVPVIFSSGTKELIYQVFMDFKAISNGTGLFCSQNIDVIADLNI